MNDSRDRASIDLEKELSRNITTYTDLSQEIITTTEDKLRLCLIENQQKLKSRREWVAPLTILITLLLSLFTTNFKSFLGLNPEYWKSIFIGGLLLALYWLIKSVCTAVKNLGKGGVDNIIENLKIKPVE